MPFSLLDLEKKCTCGGMNFTHHTWLLLLQYLVKVETRKMHVNTKSAFNITSCSFYIKVFNVSALLLDDALKQCNRLRRENVTFIEPDMWSPNSPDLNPVDYAVWVPFNRWSINVDDSRQSTSWSRRSSLSGENCPSVSLIAPLESGVASLTFHKVV